MNRRLRPVGAQVPIWAPIYPILLEQLAEKSTAR